MDKDTYSFESMKSARRFPVSGKIAKMASFFVVWTEHGVLCVKGNKTPTTGTDYTNKYPRTLETTSCNFPETKTDGEFYAGVLKARGLPEKNLLNILQICKCFQKKTNLSLLLLTPN